MFDPQLPQDINFDFSVFLFVCCLRQSTLLQEVEASLVVPHCVLTACAVMFSRRDEYTEAELPAQLIIDTVLCSNPILKVPLPLFHFFFLSFFFFSGLLCEKYVSCNSSESRSYIPRFLFFSFPSSPSLCHSRLRQHVGTL